VPSSKQPNAAAKERADAIVSNNNKENISTAFLSYKQFAHGYW